MAHMSWILALLTSVQYVFLNKCFSICCVPLGQFSETLNGWLVKKFSFHQLNRCFTGEMVHRAPHATIPKVPLSGIIFQKLCCYYAFHIQICNPSEVDFFLCGVRWEQVSFPCECPDVPAQITEKNCSFPLFCSATLFCKPSVCAQKQVSFQALYSVLCLSVFVPVSYFLNYSRFIIRLISSKSNFPCFLIGGILKMFSQHFCPNCSVEY